MIAAGERLKRRPEHLFIDENPSITPSQLLFEVRRLKREQNLRVAIVDYMQLMEPDPGKENRNREREVAIMSRAMKAIAKRVGVTMIVVSQLSRKTEERESGRPELQDLRESGSLEQDSDGVVFLWRPDETGGIIDADNPVDDPAIAWALIAKQRNGPTEDIRLIWDKTKAVFKSMEG